MARRTQRQRREAAARRFAFRTEGDLCDAFAAQARLEGFQVHAETSGWDLLLVDPESGEQVGVEAKLRANCDVLVQAIAGNEATPGPDVHAVLVPDAPSAFAYVARELDVLIFDADVVHPPAMPTGLTYRARVMLSDGREAPIRTRLKRAIRWPHTERVWVPPVEIVGAGGGRASPQRITPWKIGAVRLCRLLRKRGWLTSDDFKKEKISPWWWTEAAYGPLLKGEYRVSPGRHQARVYRYIATGKGELPDERWPEIAAALAQQPDESDG